MAEFTANALQTVATNGNVLFTETPVEPSKCINHREGSGIVTLRGMTSNCYASFLILVSGNIAVPTGATAGEISLAVAIQGEPIPSTEMVVTPTTTASFFNVSTAVYVKVPKGCCLTISVQNTSDIDIAAENMNLIVTRTA